MWGKRRNFWLPKFSSFLSVFKRAQDPKSMVAQNEDISLYENGRKGENAGFLTVFSKELKTLNQWFPKMKPSLLLCLLENGRRYCGEKEFLTMF